MKKHISGLLTAVIIFLLIIPIATASAAGEVKVISKSIGGQPYYQITSGTSTQAMSTINKTLKLFATNADMSNKSLKKKSKDYYDKTSAILLYNKNNKLSVNYEEDMFSGGAHGSLNSYSANYNTKTGQRIYLKNILDSNAKVANAKSYISYILSEKNRKLGTNLYYADEVNLDLMWTPFYFRDSGITIKFDPYEVGPFSEGFVEVTIPNAVINNGFNSKSSISIQNQTTPNTKVNTPSANISGADILLYSNDGKTFLGNISTNTYAADSIFNEYGIYGSKYSATSISNEYSIYGGPYSDESAFNKFATKPPILVYNGQTIGYVTINTTILNGISPAALAEFSLSLSK